MSPLLLTLIVSPLARTSVSAISAKRAATLPAALKYPTYRTNFTCAAPLLLKQDSRPTIMATDSSSSLSKEPVVGEVEPVAGPAQTTKEEKKEEEPKLPKLTPAEFREYNRLAEHMEYFHDHFRQSWTLIYNACVENKRPAKISLKQFISIGIQFCGHLSIHHGIEERHIFPILARKMPQFRARPAAELLRQHKQIHKGLDEFEVYLTRCKNGETELDLRVLKEQMDSWGDVLWKHLDEEVVTLGAENMRKYWTIEEIRRIPT